jgi:hypothetical protein
MEEGQPWPVRLHHGSDLMHVLDVDKEFEAVDVRQDRLVMQPPVKSEPVRMGDVRFKFMRS